MDMRDREIQPASPLIAPDTNLMVPAEPELLVETPGVMPEVEGPKERKPVSPLRESLRRLRRDTRAMVSLGMIIFLVLLSLVGPFVYQHLGGIYDSPDNGPIPATVYRTFYHQELSHQDELPSAQYWLGTDDLGRDILARLMQGLLVSISVAVLVEVIDITMGILVGVLAGYFGGWIDQVLARLTDIIFAFPGLLFIILLTGIFGTWADTTLSNVPIIGPNGNARLLLVSAALALVSWPLMARLVRGQTLQIKEQQFIEAARTAGSSNFKIIWRHIIPNLFSIVVVAATLDISNTIIGEASISLLGLGVQQPGSSLGLMISEASNAVDTHPWEVLVPSMTLAILVLAFSFLGDGLRDAFDPRTKD
ncbi:ABC transporter permease [Thermogemmatispora onikobensis]|uniref:ABC transporter permease n=1 Tax=Thermogemmatispora onikobensis TaxID=732234 RepID=UPI001C4037FD|nr:ABC transporter permease [Thermogemmatispora onikobensis]